MHPKAGPDLEIGGPRAFMFSEPPPPPNKEIESSTKKKSLIFLNEEMSNVRF